MPCREMAKRRIAEHGNRGALLSVGKEMFGSALAWSCREMLGKVMAKQGAALMRREKVKQRLEMRKKGKMWRRGAAEK